MSSSYVLNPIVSDFSTNEFNITTFTISNINVSIANAIRRTIINNTDTAVFNILDETQEYTTHTNTIDIKENTTRLNNELIKQRLCCIPIHITDTKILYPGFPIDDCVVELNVSNNTNKIIYVTTDDFKIKNIKTNVYLDDSKTKVIFPPNKQTKYYIDIVRLKPNIGTIIPSEKINLTCGITFSSGKTNSMFNSTSTATYIYTKDYKEIEIQKIQKQQEYIDQKLNNQEIEYKLKDWLYLDASRITVHNSFDYSIKTLGVITNKQLVINACLYIIKLLDIMVDTLNNNPDEIIDNDNKTTISNSFMIKIIHDDYTIGKSLEYILYEKYFSNLEILSYCGFKKLHPHDKHAWIRISYNNADDYTLVNVIDNLIDCTNILKTIFNKIKEQI
jgi:DNA-directed RNA polymerase subunit L/DNA-directed RNA polymerase alpha subunit